MKLFIYIIIIFSFSCTNSGTLTIQELEDYSKNEESMLINKVSYDNTDFSIQYIPVELIALRGSSSLEDFKKNYPANLKDYDELEYYTFVIKSNTTPTREKLSGIFTGNPDEADSYLDFYIQSDIKIVQGNDTLPCMYLHKEVSESITNQLNYSLGFVKSKILNVDRKIIFISRFKNIPTLYFLITEESIESIPPLKINSL